MATIYIDPSSATNGAGTIEDPKNTWVGLTWTAGNSYLQKRGTTFVCSGSPVTIGASGSGVGSEIVIGAYGAGDTPIITRADGTPCLYSLGRSNIIVENLNIRNTRENTVDNAVQFAGTAGSNITVRDCTLYSKGYGFQASQPLDGATVQRCTVLNHTQTGIYFYGNPSASISVKNCASGSMMTRYTAGSTFEDNTITNVPAGNTGITVQDGSGTLSVKRNNISNVQTTYSAIRLSACSFSTSEVSDNVGTNAAAAFYLENVTSTEAMAFLRNSASGCVGSAFRFIGSTSNIRIDDCTSENNTGDGYVVAGTANTLTFNRCSAIGNGTKTTTFDGDGFTNDGSNHSVVYNHCIAIGNTCSGFSFVSTSSGDINNCVVIGNGGNFTSTGGSDQIRGGIYHNTTGLNATSGCGLKIRNCIITDNYPVEVWVSTANKGWADFDYNCYNPTDDTNFATINGLTSKISWETYHATYEAHSINAAPVASVDYHLLPTSPCIGAGINVGLTSDADGNAVPGAVGHDIGPYSYMPGWTAFDGTMPPLSLASTAPGKLLEVQEWSKPVTKKQIDGVR